MNKRIELLRQKVINGHYKMYRENSKIVDIHKVVNCSDMNWEEEVTALLKYMVGQEKAIIEEDEKIVFTRTTKHPLNPIPESIQLTQSSEIQTIGYRVHNICPDWAMILEQGLQGRKEMAQVALQKYCGVEDRCKYLENVIESLDAIKSLVVKYQEKAIESNRLEVYNALNCVIYGKPKCFYHALQSLRFLQGVLWLNGHNHIGFGRFDQYMWRYLKSDLVNKVLDMDQAKEILEEFLISTNRDVDVYPGIQSGDNGQSLMLGGVTKTGESGINILTSMVLKCVSELCLADPKINIRIDKHTENYILQESASLVQKGLGFPQFSNDDVVIPSLVNNGYDIEDARDYVVAACWEFIIPGKGMDVPNINALSFLAEVDTAIREGLKNELPFQRILKAVKRNIENRVASYIDHKRNVKYWPVAPLFSSYMQNCIEQGLDINRGGAKYCNYGIHGSGASNAADALAAIKYLVYDKKVIQAKDYLKAMESNWENYSELRNQILNEAPKVGNNDSRADVFLKYLFDSFYKACENQSNQLDKFEKKIRVRAGTGSAMYYILLVKKIKPTQLEPVVGATADGRREGDFISANLAPSPGARVQGPISCLQSFSVIDYSKICNGGPITMELLQASFKGKYGKVQITNVIKIFLELGCQQLQLNMIDPKKLCDAKIHPEKYRNLIVRVWGWSAYFVDLSEEFQDHIIARTYYNSAL